MCAVLCSKGAVSVRGDRGAMEKQLRVLRWSARAFFALCLLGVLLMAVGIAALVMDWLSGLVCGVVFGSGLICVMVNWRLWRIEREWLVIFQGQVSRQVEQDENGEEN